MSTKHVCEGLTAEEYTRLFASYQNDTDEYSDMVSLIEPFLHDFKGKHVDFMSIGAGTGCFEDALIKEKGLLVEYYYAVEPNDVRRADLERIVPTWNTDYFIDDRKFAGDFEIKTTKRFDLILISHAMYFFREPWRAILRARSFLKPGGVLLVLNMTEVGYADVQREFFKVAQITGTPIYSSEVTTKSMSQELDQASVPHKVVTKESRLDVTDFIKKRETPTANVLVDIIICTRYADLPENIQSVVYEAMNERSSEENGKVLFSYDIGVIEIRSNVK